MDIKFRLLWVLFILIPFHAKSQMRIAVDSLFLTSHFRDNVQKEYRIEISNMTDSSYFFYISPLNCERNDVIQQFHSFIAQKIDKWWRLKDLLYDVEININPKYCNQKTFIREIRKGDKFVAFILTNKSLSETMKRIALIKVKDAESVLGIRIRVDFLYPFSEVVIIDD